MTDIRQHLPSILSSVRQYLTGKGTPVSLRSRLSELLPASYGIGAGCLVTGQGQQSQPVDVVIYDTTIAATLAHTDPSHYELRRVLAVIVLAHELKTPSLRKLLQTVASVKMLRSNPQQERAQAGKKPGNSLKKFLPVAIVACQSVLDLQSDNAEMLALALDVLLKEHAQYLRPDYLLMHDQRIFYSNPLLAGGSFVPSTINIAREPALKKPHPCYVCKQPFTSSHFFYQYLCLSCGDLNYSKRAISADLTGRVALVTGGRVKIGYAAALRLLRAGALVIVTTRFPHDAARRYSSEADFADWQERLQIYGLDFRHLPVLERFIEHLHERYPALDILINNAAQTVRHPLAYYARLLPFEQAPLTALTPAQQALVWQSHALLPPTPFAATGALTAPSSANISSGQIPSANLLHEYGPATVISQEQSETPIPAGEYAAGQSQIDQRERNSWTLPFNEIDLTEFLEVQVINVTAPFLLVSRLYPLLCRSAFSARFIINVSAVERQFASTKFGKHVHTNMAKASLNMLTHTAATELARDHIFMNSVDPGWISQQAPLIDAQHWERIQQLLPLDLIDAAARICDPIFVGITMGETPYGRFYKDYQPTSW
jgi:NAD(P)-dependent dehydrogenase (short-subunit alcohol dehydrogenase family)